MSWHTSRSGLKSWAAGQTGAFIGHFKMFGSWQCAYQRLAENADARSWSASISFYKLHTTPHESFTALSELPSPFPAQGEQAWQGTREQREAPRQCVALLHDSRIAGAREIASKRVHVNEAWSAAATPHHTLRASPARWSRRGAQPHTQTSIGLGAARCPRPATRQPANAEKGGGRCAWPRACSTAEHWHLASD